FAPTASHAHEGEDHGSPPLQVVVSAVPRTEAASEDFELVAMAKDATLTIYLDRQRTNAPVTNAAITVETPAGSVVASPEHGGTYTLVPPWAVTSGHYDLISTVKRDGTADVLSASLEVPAVAASPQSAPTRPNDRLLNQLRQRIAGKDPLLILTS